MRHILVLAFLFAAQPSFAWGPEGHQIVAHIAAGRLTPRARAEVGALLGGDAESMMVLNSTWADEIRADRPETADWHFVNIEMGSTGYEAARDCPAGDCIVTQIGREAKILARPGPASARAEALRFLIHFVGDIHQPLHASDDHDKGGNMFAVDIGGNRTSLHRVWDNDVVAALGGDPAMVAQSIEASLTPAREAEWSGGAPEGWANESFLVAERQIYARLPKAAPGDTVELSRDYSASQRSLVRAQLAKAGLRLAGLLNASLR